MENFRARRIRLAGSARDAAELSLRRLLAEGGLPQPDQILPHHDGGIVGLWHEERFAVIVDIDDHGAESFCAPPGEAA